MVTSIRSKIVGTGQQKGLCKGRPPMGINVLAGRRAGRKRCKVKGRNGEDSSRPVLKKDSKRKTLDVNFLYALETPMVWSSLSLPLSSLANLPSLSRLFSCLGFSFELPLTCDVQETRVPLNLPLRHHHRTLQYNTATGFPGGGAARRSTVTWTFSQTRSAFRPKMTRKDRRSALLKPSLGFSL
jgi:hypothetical protein